MIWRFPYHKTSTLATMMWVGIVWVAFYGMSMCYQNLYIQDVLLGNGNSTALNATESMEITSAGVGLDTHCSPSHVYSKHDTIPEVPLLAETHYAEVIPYIDWCHVISHDVQYDDFEDDDDCSDPEDSQVGSLPTMTSFSIIITGRFWSFSRMHWGCIGSTIWSRYCSMMEYSHVGECLQMLCQ